MLIIDQENDEVKEVNEDFYVEGEYEYFEGEGEDNENIIIENNEYQAEGEYESEDEYADGEYFEGVNLEKLNSISREQKISQQEKNFEACDLNFALEDTSEEEENDFGLIFSKEVKRERSYEERFSEMQNWVEEQLKKHSVDEELQKFQEKLDTFKNNFQDPITLDIMQTPVCLSSQKFYDMPSAINLLNKTKTCALTKEKLTDDPDKLKPNTDFKNLLTKELEKLEKKYDKLFSKFNPENISGSVSKHN